MYIVELKNKTLEPRIFCTIPEIYHVFNYIQLGTKVQNLRNHRVNEFRPFENRYCKITKMPKGTSFKLVSPDSVEQ